MPTLEVYGKPRCALCKGTWNKLAHLLKKTGREAEVDLAYYDMESVDGMAEGAFNGVVRIPTTILRDEGGEAVARWDGRLPPSAEVKGYLARAPQA